MNDKDRNSLREALHQQRRDVEDKLRRHAGVNSAHRTEDGADDLETAQRRADFAIDDLLGGNEDNLLEKIDLALERLQAGDYGQCTECKGNIPIARLRAKPSVSLCVDCQSAKEQNNR